MTAAQVEELRDLYEQDETAWFERMAELIKQRRFEELDYANLGEYLADMARRDRREVKSRLTVLLAHLLKWTHQPDRRSGGWAETILTQQQEVADLVSTGVLRNHAETVLADAYHNAVKRAAGDTGLAVDVFPSECPFSLDELIRLNQLPE